MMSENTVRLQPWVIPNFSPMHVGRQSRIRWVWIPVVTSAHPFNAVQNLPSSSDLQPPEAQPTSLLIPPNYIQYSRPPSERRDPVSTLFAHSCNHSPRLIGQPLANWVRPFFSHCSTQAPHSGASSAHIAVPSAEQRGLSQAPTS